MRITLTAIHTDPSPALWVDFTSALGEGRGRWLGAQPQVAQVHEVELNLEDEMRWQHNLWASTEGEPRIRRDKDGMHIVGQLLQADGDGCAALAIGASIVLLTLQECTVPLPRFVSLHARQISLQPLAL
ncbi:hypothetical protein [Pseudomonas sp. LD120]|uniref:hypothetical protein n=1 Tax=Pseudomonas sp. LD120 TaxID=485751 RepID=UPI00135B3B00|nr:hypothetical protein [Pseudomonas sp. LD120]KAF0864213.1 hypothetical protein PLD_26750 [Pseudomonas sp. LD120]